MIAPPNPAGVFLMPKPLAPCLAQSEYWLAYIAARTRRVGECDEWQLKPDGNGYGRIGGNSAATGVKVHRLRYALETGADPGDAHVLHQCSQLGGAQDNRLCNRIEHLALGNHAVNMAQMRERAGRGEIHAAFKRLTEQGKGPGAVAQELGVSYAAIAQWRRRNGYARGKRPIANADVLWAAKARAAGKSWYWIARQLGRTRQAIKYRVEKAALPGD